MKKFIIILFFVLSVILITLFFSGKTVDSDPLNCKDCNLIIISLTNTRKDNLGIYNHKEITSPNIDNFFKNSLIFENTFSPSPWTLPNAATLFTTLPPFKHKVISRYKDNKLPKNAKTLAQILQDNNYKTAAFTGGGDYDRSYGFNKGFDEYYDEKKFAKLDYYKDDIISWLNTNEKDKFFLFLQGFDTHCPFSPPSSPETKTCFWNLHDSEEDLVYTQGDNNETITKILSENDKEQLKNLYNEEIQEADNNLGEIFKTITDLKLDKKTIIVFLSEHGDLLGEKNQFMRTDVIGSFSDKVLNIPFLIKHPFIKTKQKINELVQLSDVMPSVLRMLNIDYKKENLQGKDITSLVSSNKKINDYVYAGLTYKGTEDSQFFRDIRLGSMIRDLNNKLVHYQIFDLENNSSTKDYYEFYNIKKDSSELNNNIKEAISTPEFKSLKNKLFTIENKTVKEFSLPSLFASQIDNVVLITIDTLRADHLSFMGYPRNTSPFLDKLVKKSILFKNAHTVIPNTAPSHASIFTGLYPSQHGVTNQYEELEEQFVTIAEVFQENRYKTLGFSSSQFLFSENNLNQGFGFIKEIIPQKNKRYFGRPASVVINKVIEKLPSKNSFLWVHFLDPHYPFNTYNSDFKNKFTDTDDSLVEFWIKNQGVNLDIYKKNKKENLIKTMNAYDTEILFVDQQIEKLYNHFEEKGLNSNTLWVITSDHGEGLGSHDFFEHGNKLYEEELLAPIIFKFPGQLQLESKTINTLVENIDIMPTILDIMDLPLSDIEMQGKSLFGKILGDKSKDEEFSVAWTGNLPKGVRNPEIESINFDNVIWDGNKISIQNNEYKYIYNIDIETKNELYDFRNDPLEKNNLINKSSNKADEFKNILMQKIKELKILPI
ncbi:sulfatase [Candidatus Falkowbacteria bacterium]|jgi:choline-sulfatase|nr:sulfatase [Candidatus Falkowbacteria bacterium]MBT4433444.1 sulfatase [Candidatus Falkowbacteria bacterium]